MLVLLTALTTGCRSRQSAQADRARDEDEIVVPTIIWEPDPPIEQANLEETGLPATVGQFEPPMVPAAVIEPNDGDERSEPDDVVAEPEVVPSGPPVAEWAPPATQPGPPPELADLPHPAVGQYVVYSSSLAGGAGRVRRTVESLGPAHGEVTVSEQTLVNNQPVGKPRTIRVPRFGQYWPPPQHSDARTIAYTRERISAAGAEFDCILLTVESRAGGSLQVQRQWISPEVPINHLARLVVLLDGREIMRQELVDFGQRAPGP